MSDRVHCEAEPLAPASPFCSGATGHLRNFALDARSKVNVDNLAGSSKVNGGVMPVETMTVRKRKTQSILRAALGAGSVLLASCVGPSQTAVQVSSAPTTARPPAPASVQEPKPMVVATRR